MTDKHLIFVRHSISKPNTDRSAHQWELTDEGRERCLKLAGQLWLHYSPSRFYSSDEPKAIETANILRGSLDIHADPLQIDTNFGETARKNAPFFADKADFTQAIHQAMLNPDELIYGEETFSQALRRFSGAVENIAQTTSTKTTIIVTHGTILSLFIASKSQMDAFTVWQSLDMPAYAIFKLPEMRLAELVTNPF